MTSTENTDEVLEKSEEHPKGPTAEQRARAERNRLRARELKEKKLLERRRVSPPKKDHTETGGGFIPEPEDTEPVKPAAPRLAPILDPCEQPHCVHCDRPFAHSHLLETFNFSACDECRDDDGPHSLITRTEAKAEYLLQDCDLDKRPPPLKCIRRRNPHSVRGEMRLYLRAQVEERALVVWGSEEALEEELVKRRAARASLKQKREAKKLRALRFDVRSTLFRRTHDAHQHTFGPEKYDEDNDMYERVCTECGHRETYEKM